MLSDPQKRAAYDQEGNPREVSGNKNSNTREKYRWKNPEFDPDYDHFADVPEHIKNKGRNKAFSTFDHFKGINNFSDGFIFHPEDWFGSHFGVFSF